MRKIEAACSRISVLLEAYFERVLPEGQAKLVAAHLERCPGCSRKLAQIERIAAALAAVPRSEPSRELAGRISVQVAALPTPTGRRRLLAGWRRLEVLAGALMVSLAGWRYALPLLLSEEAGKVQIIIWAKHALAQSAVWAAGLGHAGYTLWLALRGTPEALRLVAAAAAPTLALYAGAEIAIIAAVIMIAHRAHRARLASATILL
jgi:hypothetical protein